MTNPAQQAYAAEQAKKRAALEAKLVSLPPMQRNEANWRKFRNQLTGASAQDTIAYAEAWARLMQQGMTEGHKLYEIAEATSYEATAIASVSGRTKAIADELLFKGWAYGAQLQKWRAAQSIKIRLKHAFAIKPVYLVITSLLSVPNLMQVKKAPIKGEKPTPAEAAPYVVAYLQQQHQFDITEADALTIMQAYLQYCRESKRQ